MKRLARALLPFPVLALLLFLMWLLLTGFSRGDVLAGLAIAAFAPRLLLLVGVEKPRPRHWRTILALAVTATGDIVRSNLAVFRHILLRPPRRAGFIEMPTVLRHRYALTFLAIIITATPGTLWIRHDEERHVILIHVFDLRDKAKMIAFLKRRYEAPLREIFE